MIFKYFKTLLFSATIIALTFSYSTLAFAETGLFNPVSGSFDHTISNNQVSVPVLTLNEKLVRSPELFTVGDDSIINVTAISIPASDAAIIVNDLTKPVTIYRVDETKWPRIIQEAGNIEIAGSNKRMIFLNFGDHNRAIEFAKQKIALVNK